MLAFFSPGRSPLGMICFTFLTTVGMLRAVVAAPPQPTVTPLDLFEAIKDKQAEVRVIPRDSTVLNLLIRNNTDQPLTLQMPPALAAAPVAGQFGQPFQNNPFQPGNFNLNGNNNANTQSQAVGLPGAQNNNNNGFPVFNVPAGREIKIRLPCVCLQHGRPEPNTQIAYELRRLEDFSTDERVQSAIASLHDHADRQRVVQLAVWHLANEKTWDELAAQKIEHLVGISSPLYQRKEIAQAQQLVEALTELQKTPSLAGTSSLAETK